VQEQQAGIIRRIRTIIPIINRIQKNPPPAMKMRGTPKNGIITGISISPGGVICISPIISTIIELLQNYLMMTVSEMIEKNPRTDSYKSEVHRFGFFTGLHPQYAR